MIADCRRIRTHPPRRQCNRSGKRWRITQNRASNGKERQVAKSSCRLGKRGKVADARHYRQQKSLPCGRPFVGCRLLLDSTEAAASFAAVQDACAYLESAAHFCRTFVIELTIGKNI